METAHFAHWPAGLPKGLHYPQTSIHFSLQVSALRFPSKRCLVFYGAVLSYEKVWQQVCSLARWLQRDAGVKVRDRVLLDFQNSPQFVVGYYAILLAGGMVVPINPGSKTEELRHYLEDSGARVALSAQDVAHYFSPLLAENVLDHLVVSSYADYLDANAGVELPAFLLQPNLLISSASDHGSVSDWLSIVAPKASEVKNKREDHHWPSISPDDYCVLPYTSGSTGKPKGCIHSHRTVMASTFMGAWWKAVSPEAVVLASAPFFHVTGMIGSLHTPLMAGATIVLLPRWDAAVAGQLIESFGVTNWTNVPPMVVDLLTNPKSQGRNLSSLNQIGGGGAAMPAAIAQRLQEEYGLGYMEGYGMTEFMAATHINPAQNLKKQCLGIPVFDSAALVIDPDSLKPLGPNQQGEIVMSGPNMMLGYWNVGADPYMGGLIQIEGRTYFRSGDLGYRDEDGYYFISDRLKRMVNASGFKVWPAEVEGFFYKHPAIKECCVIGAPDVKRGETVRLVAVLKPECAQTTAEELIAWARENMANYKAPTQVVFVTALPRTSTGKIFWRQLQEEAKQEEAKQEKVE
jgi:fatty-acyl-CoA synthase